MPRIFLLAILLFCTPVVFAQPAKTATAVSDRWQPQKTWVFLVGVLEWKHAAQFPAFPQKNRRDKIFVDVLRQRGVPDQQICVLTDAEATVARIEQSFAELLRKARPDDWVIVYYCGHGYKASDGQAYFASYDSDGDRIGWRMTALPETIEREFQGARVLLAADNCYSGAMAEAVKNGAWRAGYAVLASSSANEVSTANWTFTESLIAAFRGEPQIDDDHNGWITAREMQANMEADMLFAEEQRAASVFTGNFRPSIILSPAKTASHPRIGERVEVFSAGSWYKAYIKDIEGNRFKVHYFGYEDTDDERVTAKQLRSSTPKRYPVGARVEVEWHKVWYPARVLKVQGGAHLITYEGFGREWDEWVPSRRIRTRP